MSSKQDPAKSTVGAITASDVTVYNPPLRWFQIENPANVAVVYADDTETILPNCAAGVPHPHEVKQIKATGTDSTGAITGGR